MSPLPPTQSNSFLLQWSGSDAFSGIFNYTIYVSDNGGPYEFFLRNTKTTSATFTGQVGHTYAFFSVAQDNVGNLENPPAKPAATTTIIAAPTATDLSVTKNATPSTVAAGGDITYSITVSNNGPADAANLMLTDNLPAGTTFISETQTSGPTFNCSTPLVGAGGTVKCTIAALSAGASPQFTIKVRTNCSMANGSTVSNTASISSDTSDTNANNNAAAANATVSNPPPVFSGCPAPITAVAPAACPPATGAVVSFPTPSAIDQSNCATTVNCNPPSGSIFPIGMTTVTCTATDTAGNIATCSFPVTVFNGCLQDDSNAGNVVLFNLSTGEYRFCCNSQVVATGRHSRRKGLRLHDSAQSKRSASVDQNQPGNKGRNGILADAARDDEMHDHRQKHNQQHRVYDMRRFPIITAMLAAPAMSSLMLDA